MKTDDLNPAFSARPASDGERLKNLMRAVSENSPTGAEVLKDAGDCSLLFKEFPGSAGAYLRYFNAVTLNPFCSDSVLFSTLVHEARHAAQKVPEVKNPDIWTKVQLNRVTEADAMAFECAAAFEARKKLPNVWEKFAVSHVKVAKAYVDAVCENASKSAALASAFKAWFDDRRYVDGYDQKETELFLSYPEKDALTSAQILRSVCRYGGAEYMSAEENFLYSERASFISENVYDTYERKNAAREENLSAACKDFSLSAFSVETPFKEKRYGKNAEREQKLREALSFSPTAKALTENFEKTGARIVFCSPRMASEGSDAFSKTVFIEGAASETEALYALVKGMRSLTRPADYQILPETRTMRETILTNRVAAADTGAVLGAVCYELRKENPELWRKFRAENPSQAVAYAKRIRRTGNGNAALEAAFKAFFTDKTAVRGNDEASLSEIERRSKRAGAFSDAAKDFLLKDLSVPGGEKYVSVAAFVSSREASEMDEDIFAELKRIGARVAANGGACDNSAASFCTRPKKESIMSSGKKVGAVLAAWFKGKKAR